MNTKKIILGGVVAGFLVVSAFALSLALKNSGADGGRLRGQDVPSDITETREPMLSAIPGNQVSTREFEINGLGTFSQGVAMASATSSPCIFRLPNSTSTLIDAFAVYNQPISATVSGQVFMVTRRDDYATSSIIGSTTANATYKVHGTSTVANTTSNRALPQNGWLEIYHTSSSSYTGGGYCGYHSMGAP